ncbi:MAG: PilZ domain-containing protein [Methylococcales bacterium]
MSPKGSKQSEAERRSHFRVKDEIILFFNEVTQADAGNAQGLKYQVVSGFSLSSALNQLSEESRTQMKILEKGNPELISCLTILDKKIDLIAQALLVSDLSLPSQPAREVDLSASGLAFASETEIQAGTVLELKMILPPSLVAIVALGRVVHCNTRVDQSKTEFGFNVGVDFIGLADYDRELLTRHVFKKQKAALRKRPNST